jgi:hypothetical protein
MWVSTQITMHVSVLDFVSFGCNPYVFYRTFFAFSGTLDERATRLFSLKGLRRDEYPKKVRGKNFIS